MFVHTLGSEEANCPIFVGVQNGEQEKVLKIFFKMLISESKESQQPARHKEIL